MYCGRGDVSAENFRKKDKEKDHDQDDDANGFERVLTDLNGQVVLRGGTATFSPVSFAVPGAAADMNGTYSLLTKRVNMRGKMQHARNRLAS